MSSKNFTRFRTTVVWFSWYVGFTGIIVLERCILRSKQWLSLFAPLCACIESRNFENGWTRRYFLITALVVPQLLCKCQLLLQYSCVRLHLSTYVPSSIVTSGLIADWVWVWFLFWFCKVEVDDDFFRFYCIICLYFGDCTFDYETTLFSVQFRHAIYLLNFDIRHEISVCLILSKWLHWTQTLCFQRVRWIVDIGCILRDVWYFRHVEVFLVHLFITCSLHFLQSTAFPDLVCWIDRW